jgi:O-antigen/teichoic acid export membrane protein
MLGVEQRGEVAAAILVPTIIAFGGWVGLPAATGYFVNAEPDSRALTIGTARMLALIISGGLSLISLLVTALFPLQDSIRSASMIFTIFIPLTVFRFVHEAILQADLRTVAFNAIRFTGSIVYVLLLLLLWATGSASVPAVIWAQLGATFSWFALFTVFTRSQPWFLFNREIGRSLMTYGARAHLGSISPVESLRLDQLILAIFLSPYDLGLYIIAMTFVMANRAIGTSVGAITFPLASRHASSGERALSGQIYLLLVGAAVIASFAAGLEIWFGRELLHLLFAVHDDEAYQVLKVLAVGSIFMSVSQVSSNALRGIGYPGLASVGEVISAAALLMLVTLLWNQGLIGVAWSVSLSALAMSFFLTAFLVSKLRMAE